jgi:hypothetical protein
MNETRASKQDLLAVTNNASEIIDNDAECIKNESMNELFGTLAKHQRNSSRIDLEE